MDFVGQTVRRDADDGGELFQEAVRGATPLADRSRVAVASPRDRPVRAARATSAASATTPAASTGALQLELDGGRAFGVSRKTLRELAAGRPAHQASLDLHRLTSGPARERLARFLLDSRAAGLRAVLVITGKAERSTAPDRLRDRVPDWLAGPLAASVLAFTAARAEHGGAGALYVLLRTSPP